MMHFLKSIFALCVCLVFAGCSSIMRPPSAAAFMDSYGRDDVVRNVSLSLYVGDLDDGGEENHSSLDHSEWWGDATISNFINSGFFTFGWGLQSLTPFLQTGFVSPYFGLTGWSNFATFTTRPFTRSVDDDDFLNQYSGGGELIEQIPIGEKWKLGFTEHISRNGRENYYIDEGAMFRIPNPRPKFYTEIGGGLFISHKMNDNTKMALEFRYGRDIDEKRNRFAVTFDMWFGSTPIFDLGGNTIMRKIAEKNAKEIAETKAVYMDSSSHNVHEMKLRWFEIADTSLIGGTKYKNQEKTLVVSDGVCYEESQDVAWLKRSDDSLITPLPLSQFDYCEEAEVEKSGMGTALLEGALASLMALSSGNFYVVFGVGASAAVATTVLLKVYGPDIPVVKQETCAAKHTVEEKRAWLKQYPCGAK